jgi:pyruvate,water dikinase
VQSYSRAQDIDTAHQIAVVVQQMIQADIAGVLFTIDPVTGSHTKMTGNYVHGLGERLVSGEVNPHTFTLTRPGGQYSGPPELKRLARKLYRLAGSLEKKLGCPQDIEWAIAGDKLFLLQSRPITTLPGHNPASGEWNDSLAHDFLWSRVNFGEALPDVMTPFTWTLHKNYIDQMSLGPHLPFGGNIGGRLYTNISQTVSLFAIMDKNVRRVLGRWEPLIGHIPEGIEVRPISLLRLSTILSVLRALMRITVNLLKATRKTSVYLEGTSAWCYSMTERIQNGRTKEELVPLWHTALLPYYLHSMWVGQAAGTQYVLPANRLRSELIELVGITDANALLANVSNGAGLASLGPLVGLSKVARGELSREAYLRQYGHRGPHELELSIPHPAEDPDWLDQQLAEFASSPIVPDVLLAKQHAAFNAAWQRFLERYPQKATSVQRRLERIAEAVRIREATRSELVHVLAVIRLFALRAGQLTGLGEDIFFLYVDEVLDTLSGDNAATTYVSARREAYDRYKALPPYPAIINGRFDPFRWAADSNRRYDFFDAHASTTGPTSDVITGFAGAAGCVEGIVRRLDSPQEGDQLRPGEILVAATTNVGWTLLFTKAAAIVTDVGAPLSHAAIIARELGIPAVVGCGEATTRLHTGDRVLVDGGQGTVEILDARR